MAKRKPRVGSFVEISVSDGSFAYARVLPNSQLAVYTSRVKPNAQVASKHFLASEVSFVTTVMNSAFRSDKWAVFDWAALEPEFDRPFFYFMHDAISGVYSIYRSTDGAITPASRSECEDLEPAAVWEAEHLDERLRLGAIPAGYFRSTSSST